ncbi:MAG: hypothetical protein ACTS9Y_00260 [Methylophilus sp.]|uniref:hypothetical protein n=1 Tax=Methylophilus sp. TaxID=29541 RepID=UPI003FA18553
MKFEEKQFAGRPDDEKNDCVVRGFSIAAGIDYLEAHAVVAECGRRRRMRTKNAVIDEAANVLKLTKRRVRRGMTVQRMLVELAGVPQCAIWVRGHIIPVIRGVEIDFKQIAKPKQIVRAVYISANYDFGKL